MKRERTGRGSVRRLSGCVLLAVLLAGCVSHETYREERIARAARHFEDVRDRELPDGAVLTLVDCIELALLRNVDLEVSRLEEQIARERVTAEVLGMLPDLEVSDNWYMRSNRPGSSSRSITYGGATYSYSQSSEKYENNFRVEMALSVIDFGLAYLNASQASDRALIEKERLRRAEQNLRMEVVRCFFKVAATQDAVEITETLLARCRNVESLIDGMLEKRQVSPLLLYDEYERFIRLQQRLSEYRRNYEDGCIELRALLGMAPNSRIKLDTSALRREPDFPLPEVELLERAALLERPELLSMDMQSHVALTETRRALLLMFPNVRIFADFNKSSNIFLYKASWMELGVRAAYNLLKLPQQVARYRALAAEHRSMDARTLALTIGVMTQVRIAHANLLEVREKYALDDRVFRIYSRHLNEAEQHYRSGSTLSQLELDRLRLEAAETEIQRSISLGRCLVGYYQLMNAVGVSSLETEVLRERTAAFDKLVDPGASLKKAALMPSGVPDEQ